MTDLVYTERDFGQQIFLLFCMSVCAAWACSGCSGCSTPPPTPSAKAEDDTTLFDDEVNQTIKPGVFIETTIGNVVLFPETLHAVTHVPGTNRIMVALEDGLIPMPLADGVDPNKVIRACEHVARRLMDMDGEAAHTTIGNEGLFINMTDLNYILSAPSRRQEGFRELSFRFMRSSGHYCVINLQPNNADEFLLQLCEAVFRGTPSTEDGDGED